MIWRESDFAGGSGAGGATPDAEVDASAPLDATTPDAEADGSGLLDACTCIGT